MSHHLKVPGKPRKLSGRKLLKILRKHPDDAAVWAAYVAVMLKGGFIEIDGGTLTDGQICALTGASLSYIHLISQLTGDEISALLAGAASISDLQLKVRMQNGHGDKLLSQFTEQRLFERLEARTAPQS